MSTAPHRSPAPQPLWQPGPDRVTGTQLTRYQDWAARRYGAPAGDPDDPSASYHALHAWSVREPERFWQSVTDWFDVRFATPYETVLADASMPGARWFPCSVRKERDELGNGKRAHPGASLVQQAPSRTQQLRVPSTETPALRKAT